MQKAFNFYFTLHCLYLELSSFRQNKINKKYINLSRETEPLDRLSLIVVQWLDEKHLNTIVTSYLIERGPSHLHDTNHFALQQDITICCLE